MRVTYRQKMTLVEPDFDEVHNAALKYIWSNSKINEESYGPDILKWRKLGFDSEDITQEFREVGLLGLQCLVSTVVNLPGLTSECLQKHFVAKDPDYWAKVSYLVTTSLFSGIGDLTVNTA